jgi:hypothetical protein
LLGDVSVKNLSGRSTSRNTPASRDKALAFSPSAIVSVSLFVLNLPLILISMAQIVYQLAELAKGSPLSGAPVWGSRSVSCSCWCREFRLLQRPRGCSAGRPMRLKLLAAIPALLAVPAVRPDRDGEFTVGDIKIEGLQRISGARYSPPGQYRRSHGPASRRESLKALAATGFFRDVELRRDAARQWR